MTDEAGSDAKLIAVPHSKVSMIYDPVRELADLPELLKQQIEHFFSHYKELEPGKWVKIEGWSDREAAEKEVLDAAARYQQSLKK
jgi:inorganic pyrophosphatase